MKLGGRMVNVPGKNPLKIPTLGSRNYNLRVWEGGALSFGRAMHPTGFLVCFDVF